MEILSLTDNLCALPGCKAQHGLSLYIKTKKHKDDPYTAERVEEAFRNLRHTPEKESQFS